MACDMLTQAMLTQASLKGAPASPERHVDIEMQTCAPHDWVSREKGHTLSPFGLLATLTIEHDAAAWVAGAFSHQTHTRDPARRHQFSIYVDLFVPVLTYSDSLGLALTNDLLGFQDVSGYFAMNASSRAKACSISSSLNSSMYWH